jgi:hypothetical protein
MEAAMGIEPMIKVLQTLALPLGYAAFLKNRGGLFRTRRSKLIKQV